MKASRAASSRGEDGTVNYNPFARVRSRESVDIENQNNHRTHSEARIQQTLEEQRHLESRQTEKEFPSLPHADTAPAVSPTTTGGSRSVEKQTAAPISGIGKESADISDDTVVGSTETPGVTKRAKFKHIFRKSHDDEDSAPVARTETEGLSFEERTRRAHKRKIPFGTQFRAALLGSWINVLLIFVPVGFAINYAHVGGPWPTFIINFIAIIPLAATLSFATEELAIRVGETFGGLLNASFGYVVADHRNF